MHRRAASCIMVGMTNNVDAYVAYTLITIAILWTIRETLRNRRELAGQGRRAVLQGGEVIRHSAAVAGLRRSGDAHADRLAALEARALDVETRTATLERLAVAPAAQTEPADPDGLLPRLDSLWRLVAPAPTGRRSVDPISPAAVDDNRRRRIIATMLADGMTVEVLSAALGLSWSALSDDVMALWRTIGDDPTGFTDNEQHAIRLAGLHVTTRRARLAREAVTTTIDTIPTQPIPATDGQIIDVRF